MRRPLCSPFAHHKAGLAFRLDSSLSWTNVGYTPVAGAALHTGCFCCLRLSRFFSRGDALSANGMTKRVILQIPAALADFLLSTGAVTDYSNSFKNASLTFPVVGQSPSEWSADS